MVVSSAVSSSRSRIVISLAHARVLCARTFKSFRPLSGKCMIALTPILDHVSWTLASVVGGLHLRTSGCWPCCSSVPKPCTSRWPFRNSRGNRTRKRTTLHLSSCKQASQAVSLSRARSKSSSVSITSTQAKQCLYHEHASQAVSLSRARKPSSDSITSTQASRMSKSLTQTVDGKPEEDHWVQ